MFNNPARAAIRFREWWAHGRQRLPTLPQYERRDAARAYQVSHAAHDAVEETAVHVVDPGTLMFALGIGPAVSVGLYLTDRMSSPAGHP